MKKALIGGVFVLLICGIITSVAGYFGYVEFVQKPQEARDYFDEFVAIDGEAEEAILQIDQNFDQTAEGFIGFGQDLNAPIEEAIVKLQELDTPEQSVEFRDGIIASYQALIDLNNESFSAEVFALLENPTEESLAEYTAIFEEYESRASEITAENEELQENYADEFGFELILE